MTDEEILAFILRYLADSSTAQPDPNAAIGGDMAYDDYGIGGAIGPTYYDPNAPYLPGQIPLMNQTDTYGRGFTGVYEDEQPGGDNYTTPYTNLAQAAWGASQDMMNQPVYVNPGPMRPYYRPMYRPPTVYSDPGPAHASHPWAQVAANTLNDILNQQVYSDPGPAYAIPFQPPVGERKPAQERTVRRPMPTATGRNEMPAEYNYAPQAPIQEPRRSYSPSSSLRMAAQPQFSFARARNVR